MHGNLMYEMARQRIADQQRAARDAGQARELRRGRSREQAPETPVIPDFPHEMFAESRGPVPEPRREAAGGRRARSGS